MKIKNIIKMGIFCICMFFTKTMYVDAASAYISVSSNTSRIVIGNTFTVNVTVSSSSPLGSWEYTIDYNSNTLKYISGTYSVADYGNGSKTSQSYSYTFKAIASGNGYVGVKSYAGYAWDESKFDMSAGSKTVNVISQAELEASYSKDNSLGSLSVNGAEITPSFDTNTKDYSVKVSSDTEKITINASPSDSRASITGNGEHEVSEGENKFEIIVTAENGSKNTYTLIVNVEDPNPINVKTSDNRSLTVVKRVSSLTKPKTFENTEISINGIEVPAFYSSITKLTLVGLKDTKGNLALYSYDKDNNTYTLYREILFSSLTIYPMELIENAKYKEYAISEIEINDEKVEAYKLNSNYFVFYGLNIETNEKGYYIYDKTNNAIIRHSTEDIEILNEKINKYEMIIIILIGMSVILLMIVIFVSTHKRKKIRRLVNEIKSRNQNDIVLEMKNETAKEENEIINEENEKETIEEADEKEIKKPSKNEVKEKKKQEKEENKKKNNKDLKKKLNEL